MTTLLPPPKCPVDRAIWLKHQLELRGISYAQIARDEGVSRQAVNKAVYHPYPKMERAIAKRLGMSPCEIWPERTKHA